MSRLTVRTVEVTGDQVRVGDVIAVGGLPHTVSDVRQVRPDRRRLEFEDGNAYVLGRGRSIRVVRTSTDRGR
ncbi:hypothetical protein [Streptomyces roseolilacinus]|uniref:Uncharacterized protein n=1 Tax=Streptomyces roseolilacinus TaxID=66904 RepID=A0A918EJA1_9ACTN|nr:hypothetical protein [Streptomyces roseolilacinus]GGP90511.1 hypothetical protein GCM10010249_05660 [Streptomyces roseolilacinus]